MFIVLYGKVCLLFMTYLLLILQNRLLKPTLMEVFDCGFCCFEVLVLSFVDVMCFG